MDMKFTKLLTLPSLTALLIGLFPPESPHSLFGQVKKNCFLAFHSPPPLRFHEIAEAADRSNLLILGKPVSQNFEVNIVDGNKSAQVNEFPLTSYGDDTNDSSSDTLPDNVNFLPPFDPFSEYNLGDSNIDSTDQLIELFENLEKTEILLLALQLISFHPTVVMVAILESNQPHLTKGGVDNDK